MSVRSSIRTVTVPFRSGLSAKAVQQRLSKPATSELHTTRLRMADIKRIETKNAATPAAAYSQAIQIPGLIFVSGQIPAKPSGELVQGSITESTRQCIANVQAILEAAGSSLAKAVRVGVFLTDMAHFQEMNAEYAKWFGETKPARACVAVRQLPLGVDVEIEATALP